MAVPDAERSAKWRTPAVRAFRNQYAAIDATAYGEIRERRSSNSSNSSHWDRCVTREAYIATQPIHSEPFEGI
jgi:hypothetical protein